VVEVVESMVGVLSGESPSEPYSFSTRGFTRNSIGVLYDGVSMGVSTLNMRPQSSFNLDRIEVVKGASVLNANDGSAGGTVNIITKIYYIKPTYHYPFYIQTYYFKLLSSSWIKINYHRHHLMMFRKL
jgi:outer membrane receptor protein involved in Fe transport